MTDLIRLRVPPGAADAEISWGTENYRPFLDDPSDADSEMHVLVPRHAAPHFIHNGGFEIVSDEQEPAPVGIAFLMYPDGSTTWPNGTERTISLDGKVITGDELGRYPTPAHRVEEVKSHGLVDWTPAGALAAAKEALEEKFGLEDAAEANRALTDAKAATDAALARAATAEQELLAAHTAIDEATARATAAETAAAAAATVADDARDALQKAVKENKRLLAAAKSDDKESAALEAELEAKEEQITTLLNQAELAKDQAAAIKKK